MTPGPLDLYIQYTNDSSGGNGFIPQYRLTMERPMDTSEKGWQRWEAAMPTFPQLR